MIEIGVLFVLLAMYLGWEMGQEEPEIIEDKREKVQTKLNNSTYPEIIRNMELEILNRGLELPLKENEDYHFPEKYYLKIKKILDNSISSLDRPYNYNTNLPKEMGKSNTSGQKILIYNNFFNPQTPLRRNKLRNEV